MCSAVQQRNFVRGNTKIHLQKGRSCAFQSVFRYLQSLRCFNKVSSQVYPKLITTKTVALH